MIGIHTQIKWGFRFDRRLKRWTAIAEMIIVQPHCTQCTIFAFHRWRQAQIQANCFKIYWNVTSGVSKVIRKIRRRHCLHTHLASFSRSLSFLRIKSKSMKFGTKIAQFEWKTYNCGCGMSSFVHKCVLNSSHSYKWVAMNKPSRLKMKWKIQWRNFERNRNESNPNDW